MFGSKLARAKHFPYFYPSTQILGITSTPTKTERIESFETSALKAQTPGDHPKNAIRDIFAVFSISTSERTDRFSQTFGMAIIGGGHCNAVLSKLFVSFLGRKQGEN